jgi:hypothetical protein
MISTHVIWDELPWQQGNHPLEFKKVVPETPCVLLMFMPGFSDPNLCQRSHVLHVLEGLLTLELEGEVLRVAAGQSCVLPADTTHRARNDDAEPAIVLALSDLRWG